jgi:hypothetical protein
LLRARGNRFRASLAAVTSLAVVFALIPLGTAVAQPPGDSVTLTPETDSAAVNTCNEFTVTVIDDGAPPAAGTEVDGFITQSDADALQDLEISFCDPATGAPVAPSDLDDNAVNNDGLTDFATEPPVPPAGLEAAAVAETEPIGADGSVCVTDALGQCTFGVISDEAGTMNVRASAEVDGATLSDDSVKTWVVPTVAAVDCSPETDNNPEGTAHNFTCTALSAAEGGVPVPNVQLWFDVTAGPNAEEQGSQPCTGLTSASGVANCTYTDAISPASLPGTDTIVGYFNLACPRTGVAVCSNAPEPDEPQDEILKTFSGPPRIVDCEPEEASNRAGTTHTVTCTVTDRAGQPVPDVLVSFEETGPGRFATGSQTESDTTDANGEATADVTTTAEEEGDQTVTGSLPTTVGVDECERAANDPVGAPAGVCTDDVTKSWIPPQIIRSPSAITLRHRLRPRHVFRGRVDNELPRCERGRRVVIRKRGTGIVARDRTNQAGRFVAPHRRGGRGRYFAVVLRKTFVNADGDNVICQRARSRTIRARR